MHNPEFNSEREPSAEESAEKFSAIIASLDQARQGFLDRELAGVELHEEDRQELFKNFETKRAESIIKSLNLPALGWFATPESSDDSASDLDATGDLFIDTTKMIVYRAESTSASTVSSSQFEIERQYKINPSGRLSVHTIETRENFSLTGEPSIDEDMHNVIERLDKPSRIDRTSPIKREVLSDDERELPAVEAKLVVEDISKLISLITKLYDDASLMINEDTFKSSEEDKKYIIEAIEDYE